MRTLLSGKVGNVPLMELRRARSGLRDLPNAYGLLAVARILNAAAALASAVERAPRPSS